MREPETEIDDNCEGPERRAVEDDIRYFRSNPLKRWRLRPRISGERFQMHGAIAARDVFMLILRPMRFNDGTVVLKIAVTPGPENDPTDPWIMPHHALTAVRASVLSRAWEDVNRTIQVRVTDDGTRQPWISFQDVLDKTKFEPGPFAGWLMQDPERLVRLSEFRYGQYFSHFPDAAIEDLIAEGTTYPAVQRAAERMVRDHSCRYCAAHPLDQRVAGGVQSILGMWFWFSWQSHGRLFWQPEAALAERLDKQTLRFDDALPVVMARACQLVDVRGLAFTEHLDDGVAMPVMAAGLLIDGASITLNAIALDGRLLSLIFNRGERATWSDLYGTAMRACRDYARTSGAFDYGRLAHFLINLLYLHAYRQREYSVGEKREPAARPPAQGQRPKIHREALPLAWLDALAAPPLVRSVETPRGPLDKENLVLAETVQSAHARHVRVGPGRSEARIIHIPEQRVLRWMRPEDVPTPPPTPTPERSESMPPEEVFPTPEVSLSPPEEGPPRPTPPPRALDGLDAPPTLEGLIERLRTKVRSDQDNHRALMDKLRKMLDTYDAARKQDVITRVGIAQGLATETLLRAPHVANGLFELISQLPELNAGKVVGHIAESAPPDTAATCEPGDDEPFSYAITLNEQALVKASQQTIQLGVLVVSSRESAQRAAFLKSRGLRFEWAAIDDGDRNRLASRATQVRNRSYCAVLMHDGFISHNVMHVIKKAAEDAQVPLERCGRGSKAAVQQALERLGACFTP